MDQTRQTIEARFNGIVVFFYCLLIYFLPISIALTETMAGFVIFFFAIKKAILHNHDVRHMPQPVSVAQRLRLIVDSLKLTDSCLNTPMGIFIFIVLMSCVFSQYVILSIVAFFGKLLEGYLLYLIFADCVKTKAHLRNFIGVYFVSALLMGVNGIAQYFTHTEFVRGTPLVDGRVSSSLRHANDFGAYLTLVIPLLLSLLLLQLKKVSLCQEWKDASLGCGAVLKILLGLIFIAVAVNLGLTYSRGSWIGFLFSLAALVLFRKRGYLFAGAVGLIFMMIFIPMLGQARDVSFVSDNTKHVDKYESQLQDDQELNIVQKFFLSAFHHRDFTGMGRMGFWSEAIGVIKRFPVLGSGLNTYARMGTQFGYAHNCYLQMAAEIGILGVAAFLFMLGVFFCSVFKALPAVKDPFLYAVLAGSMAGLIGFLVQSFFDTTFYSVQLGNLMWIFMGLIVAAKRLGTARNN